MRRWAWVIGAVGACALPSMDEFARGPTASTNDGGLDAMTVEGVDAANAGDAAHHGSTAPLRSCAEIRTDNPSAPSGIYPSVSGDIYCEMTVDNGGWTLIARSAGADAGSPFGWKEKRGDVHENSDAYCLPVLTIDLPFDEVLIGTPADQNRLGIAYKLALPRGALERASSTNVIVPTIQTVIGSCMPAAGPEMLSKAGFTENDDHFLFRDNLANAPFGLFADGFAMYYDDCDHGGGLTNLPGLLFVR